MTDQRQTPNDRVAPFSWMGVMATPPIWTTMMDCARVTEPLAVGVARANLGISSLVGSRARAWAAIPSTLAACRQPSDLLQAQISFWETATRDYTEASRHMMSSWRYALPSFGEAMAEEPQARDYITFPMPKDDDAAEERRHPGAPRKAA